MQATALFWLTIGPYVAAAILALIADASRDSRGLSGVTAGALLLAGGGVVSVAAGWLYQPRTVYATFLTGAGYSTVVGVIGLLGASALFAARSSGKGRAAQGAVLVALSCVGLSAAATAVELTAALLALEIASVCGYALVSLTGGARSREAAFRYFVLSSVGTGIAIMGLAVLGGSSGGDLSFEGLSHMSGRLASPYVFVAGIALLTGALSVKLGAAPFHFWAPDAYEAAPPYAAAFMAGAGKLAVAILLASFIGMAVPRGASGVLNEGSRLGDVIPLVAAIAVVSIAIGSLGALVQRSYVRMLGYAGVAQLGYALIAIAALNASSALLFLVTYAVATTAAFVGAEAFVETRDSWDGTVRGLAGLGREHPVLGSAVSVALMSLAGIPPLVGFWGKFQSFGAAIGAAVNLSATGPTWASAMFTALAAVGIIGSVVSLAYYGAVVRSLFFDSAPAQETTSGGGSRTGGVVIILAGALAAAGVAPALVGISRCVAGFIIGM